jgi:glycosyltransferase involved in cell wall biosynthesis
MVYFAMSPWNGMWKNRHQLMTRFAAEMPVLYVEPWVRLRYLRRHPLSLLGRADPGDRVISPPGIPNLSVYSSPATRPVSGSKLIGRWTADRWLAGARAAGQALGIRRPIIWLSLPEMAFAAGQMNELMSIYHVVDEYGGYARQTTDSQRRLWAREEQMLDSVDMTIVVSPELAKAKQKPGRTIHIVENAVDFEAFSRAAAGRRSPADLSSLPGPRLGYCGLIGQRLDLDLLIGIAEARPDWSLVLIGKVDDTDCADRLARLRALRNVHFLGQKAVGEVPDYIAGLDAGLLPYTLNLETENISPLKMYEYFAAGIPVVSTPIPAALRHSDFLDVGSGDDEFIRLCERALVPDDVARRCRTDHARANTWNNRVDLLRRLLHDNLASRGIGS